MQNRAIWPLLLIATVTFGFGCNPSNSPVSLDKYKVDQPAENESSPESPEASVTEPEVMAPTEESAPEQAMATSSEAESNETSHSSEETMTEEKTPEKLAFPGILPEAQLENKQIRIKTDKGDIVFELLGKEGPKAASNFIYLTERGFYNGLTFHRVEPGFVIQGGDPAGNGTGGPGYKFEDDTVNLSYKEGIVAMANAGPNTNGSQFFIMLAENPLPPNYSIFGRVTSGMDVVKKIAIGDVMTSVVIEPLKK